MQRSILTGCAVALASLAIAPAVAAAKITPGTMTFTQGAQCTANFVFSDGANTYLGQAAHCSGTGASTDTNGCTSASLPLGTQVQVNGASRPGALVYNSWLTMQAKNEPDPDTCAFNDLALVRIDPADAGAVDPTVPGFGGPNGVAEAPSDLGATVFTYGNSELRGGVTKVSPKQGTVVQAEGGGWSRYVYTITPGIPGDSGSGFMDSSGNAIGVLSTVAVAPLTGSNGMGDLARELAYMRANSRFSGVQLVKGTRPFNASLVDAILGA